MLKKQFYVNLNTLLRQLFFMTEKGTSVEDAIEQLEKQTGLHKELSSINSMFSESKEQVTFPYSFGYIALLSNLIGVIKSYGGNVSLCYKEFYDRFIQNPNRIKLHMKDSIGILIYLGSITMVSSICVAIYLIFVLPQFKQTFQGAGHKLPGLTELVLTISSEYSILFLSMIVVVMNAIVILLRNMFLNVNNLNYFLDKHLQLPYIGEIFKSFNIYLSFNILSLVIKSGLTKNEGLDALEKISNNNCCIDTAALKNCETTKPYSAEYSLSLASSVDTFEEELSYLVNKHEYIDAQKLNQLKTSIFVLFVGFAVFVFGTILIAMYLPIFQMGKLIL